jgi:hypothetical protein
MLFSRNIVFVSGWSYKTHNFCSNVCLVGKKLGVSSKNDI